MLDLLFGDNYKDYLRASENDLIHVSQTFLIFFRHRGKRYKTSIAER